MLAAASQFSNLEILRFIEASNRLPSSGAPANFSLMNLPFSAPFNAPFMIGASPMVPKIPLVPQVPLVPQLPFVAAPALPILAAQALPILSTFPLQTVFQNSVPFLGPSMPS